MVSPGKLSILPIIMIGFSVCSVYFAFGLTVGGYALWALGMLLSFVLNLKVLRMPAGARFDPHNNTFHMPGSWAPLTLFMAFFVVKYFVNAALAVHALSAQDAAFVYGSSLTFGLLSGTFLARAWYANRNGHQNPLTAAPLAAAA